MDITMTNGQEELWKVEAIVDPKVEWEKIGIDSFKISADECVAFERELENKTQLSVTIVSDRAEVYNKAQLVLKSFLSLLDLEAGRGYRPTISNASVLTKDGQAFVGNVLFGHFKAIRRFENLDLSLLKSIANSLEILGADKRERVLQALNFLYDALAAPSAVQSYLTVYGGLNFLTSSVGQQKNTLLSDAMTLFEFIGAKILNATDAMTFMKKFQQFHSRQYEVSKSNRVEKQELDEIKAFFKEFLAKYIEYGKIKC